MGGALYQSNATYPPQPYQRSKLQKPSPRIRLTSAVKLDLAYFNRWCNCFNGVAYIPDQRRPQPDTTIYTDASPLGGAAFCNKDFIFTAWDADSPIIAEQQIYVKELAAVVLAMRRWSPFWINKLVHIHTDNKGVEGAIRKGSSRHVIANTLLKELLWRAAICNISLCVSYVRSKDNFIADALSRIHDPVHMDHAVKFLAAVGTPVSSPYFNLYNHMSVSSYLSVFGKLCQ